MSRYTVPAALTLTVLLAATPGCRHRDVETSARFGQHESSERQAAAILTGVGGAAVSGHAHLSQLVTPFTEGDFAKPFPEVSAYIALEGLHKGPVTVRIHDAADCEAPDAAASSGPNARVLSPSESGAASVSASLSRASLVDGDDRSLVGKTVVVHAGTGETGQPLACGVIQAATPELAAAHHPHGVGGHGGDGGHGHDQGHGHDKGDGHDHDKGHDHGH